MKLFLRSSFFSIYGFSCIATSVLIALIGFNMGTSGLVAMLTLTALEVTFSLDNAVVNAQVLEHMSAFWRRMFMTVGILIAVFGMRLVLPILVVALTASLNVADVINLALSDPQRYAAELEAAHPVISAFGGAFLLMIFLDFLVSDVRVIARALRRHKAGPRLAAIFVAITLLAIVSVAAPASTQVSVMVSGLIGLAGFLGVRAVSDWFIRAHASAAHVGKVMVRGGFIAFLYLELLDASFSFDGVIGAFAITNNILLIAAGLGAGAVWVRSITIDLVKNGTLRHYPYLDLGAHMAIGSLAVLLLVDIGFTLPSLLSGALGLVIILTSFFASVLHNHRAAKAGASTRKA